MIKTCNGNTGSYRPRAPRSRGGRTKVGKASAYRGAARGTAVARSSLSGARRAPAPRGSFTAARDGGDASAFLPLDLHLFQEGVLACCACSAKTRHRLSTLPKLDHPVRVGGEQELRGQHVHARYHNDGPRPTRASDTLRVAAMTARVLFLPCNPAFAHQPPCRAIAGGGFLAAVRAPTPARR